MTMASSGVGPATVAMTHASIGPGNLGISNHNHTRQRAFSQRDASAARTAQSLAVEGCAGRSQRIPAQTGSASSQLVMQQRKLGD